MNWKIPLFRTYWKEQDIEAVKGVITRGTYWATGPEIEEFEGKIRDYTESKFALSFNSGTSALHCLLLACDVKGKEVIVPSFTFIATANAVLLAGGIPVFAESESDTLSLDAQDVKNKITEKTKAIISLDYGGFGGRDTEELHQIAKENNLLFITDSAESLGAKIKDKMVGTMCDAAIFSFCQNKVLTTGEGGMIVTDNKEFYEKCKLLRSHGRVEEIEGDYFSSTDDNDYIQPGYNFRMPTMNAALGLSQFSRIEEVISMRRNNAHTLRKNLEGCKGIAFMKEIEGDFQVYQMFTIICESKEIRDKIQLYLKEKGIMTKVYFNPIHQKTIFKKLGYREGDLPRTENLSSRVLTLPMFPDLSIEQINLMSECIKESVREDDE